MLGQHPGAGAGGGLQPPPLGQGHGAVAQGPLGGHLVQQAVGDAVHAVLGLVKGQPVQVVHGFQQELVHRVVEEAALVPGVESVGLQPLGAQAVLGEIGEGALGEALQPGDALPADRAVERPGGGGVQAVRGLGGDQRGAQPVKSPAQGGVARRQRGQPRQRGGIVPGQRHPLGALGQRPGDVGHGALRRGAEHAGHAGVAGDAAARAESGEYAPDQRRQRAGVLGGVVHAAQGPADAQVVRGHLEGGFQVVAPQHGQLGVVGAQVGVGHAGHLLELGGVEQPVGVGPGPVRLAQHQQRLHRAAPPPGRRSGRTRRRRTGAGA